MSINIATYRDFYGSTARIRVDKVGQAKLHICNSYGQTVINKIYSSIRGAKIALGRYSDDWRKID